MNLIEKTKIEVQIKTSLFILLSAFSFIIASCISCDEMSDRDLGDHTIEVVDSLYIDGVYDLEFLDIDSENKSFLFYSATQKMIFLFDRKSKRTIKIPFPGHSTSISGYSFKSACFYLLNSIDSIMIWTDRGYHFYDAEGNFLREVEFKTSDSHPKSVFFNVVEKNNQLIAIQRHKREYLRNGDFSKEESKFIQTYNFSNNESKLYKGFQNDNPVMPSGDFLVKATFEGSEFLHVLLSPDNTISTYSIDDDFQLISNKKMDIPDYTPSYARRYTPQDQVIQPNIYWVFSDSKYFYVVYKPFIDPEKNNINFSNNGVIDDSSYDFINFFLYTYDQSSGEENVFELPKQMPGFQAKLEDDLFLVQPSSFLTEHRLGNIFYIVSLRDNI